MFRVIFFFLQDMEAAVAAQLNECQRATDLQEKCDFMEQCNDEVSFPFHQVFAVLTLCIIMDSPFWFDTINLG